MHSRHSPWLAGSSPSVFRLWTWAISQEALSFAGPKVEDEPMGASVEITSGLRASFDQAFAAIDPAYQPRLQAEWDWRTRQVPGGAPAETLLDRRGRVQAHYAALGTRVLDGEQRLPVAQVVDTFAANELSLPRRVRAFTRACEGFVERTCLPAAGGFLLCYGFPVRPAWRIGRAHLGYTVLQEFWRQGIGAQDAARSLVAGDLAFEEDCEWPGELDAFFAQHAGELGLPFMRDTAFLRWRFDQRPNVKYNRCLLRRGSKLAGWAVLRVTDWAGERVALVCDRFCATGDQEAELALDHWLGTQALAAGVTHLVAAGGEHSPEFRDAQERGWRIARSDYCMVGRSFDPDRPDSDWARRLRWTLADTDLV